MTFGRVSRNKGRPTGILDDGGLQDDANSGRDADPTAESSDSEPEPDVVRPPEPAQPPEPDVIRPPTPEETPEKDIPIGVPDQIPDLPPPEPPREIPRDRPPEVPPSPTSGRTERPGKFNRM